MKTPCTLLAGLWEGKAPIVFHPLEGRGHRRPMSQDISAQDDFWNFFFSVETNIKP